MIAGLGVGGMGGKKKSRITNTDPIIILQTGGLGNKNAVYISAIGASPVADDKCVVDRGQAGMITGHFLIGHYNGVTFFSPHIHLAPQGE